VPFKNWEYFIFGLQEEGGRSLAPELQEQIEETLEELSPRCVLELLASPLDKEHEIQREEGLQGLKSILWAVGEGGAAAPIRGFTREQFIKDTFSFLTSSEQVNFHNFSVCRQAPQSMFIAFYNSFAVQVLHRISFPEHLQRILVFQIGLLSNGKSTIKAVEYLHLFQSSNSIFSAPIFLLSTLL
jgi:hypothetical protein